ncbi:cytochrome P450 [Acidovorax sp. Be4]|uniref:Cytochrome P450 n=1 Tax=Acidovorax bellezanensis TaxID=2976702 RepID=A0ABT2PTD3_9BURK|nr:cytochrome P450 [Acidovorax sp. Be4]MCT9813181.1 cytochrome P450 [Acidovorax sp. Be4]
MSPRPLPPGPRWLRPLNFFQAGLTPPAPVLARLAARYGDPFRVSYFSRPVTFTGNPQALRAIYTAHPDCFDVWGGGFIEPVFGETSVVVISGDRHRQDRNILAPAFSGPAMRNYGETMAAVADEKMAQVEVGRPFRMLAVTQRITLDIMIRVVFGMQDEARVRRTRAAVLELIESLHVILFLFPSARRVLGGHGPWARNQRAVDALRALLREQMRERRASGAPGTDLLGRMLAARYDDGSGMEDAEILDQMRGLLFAGHEATATVLTWIFYWLGREPAVFARVAQEIEALGPEPAPEALAALPYLDLVCKECLRLYPPVVDPARVVRAPFELLGYTIPAGEVLRASSALLHSRPELYPEPQRFWPERFLERKYSPFEYIPFGGGARRCLGAAFAMYELKVVVATILHSHRLRLLDTGPVAHARRALSLGPRGGIAMVVEERRRPAWG